MTLPHFERDSAIDTMTRRPALLLASSVGRPACMALVMAILGFTSEIAAQSIGAPPVAASRSVDRQEALDEFWAYHRDAEMSVPPGSAIVNRIRSLEPPMGRTARADGEEAGG